MLSKSELDAMDSCMSDIYNCEITIASHTGDGTWTPIITAARCLIQNSSSVERARALEYALYTKPFDAHLRVSFDSRIKAGNKITVTKTQGLSPAASEFYEIISVTDILNLNRQLECRLSKLDN